MGIEGLEDLEADFAQALKKVAGGAVASVPDTNGHATNGATSGQPDSITMPAHREEALHTQG